MTEAPWPSWSPATILRDVATKIGWGEAPAKAILVGEHAVVYGQPALAVPLFEFRARAQARFDHSLDDVIINLEGRRSSVSLERNPENPLALAVRLALQALGTKPGNLELRLTSSVPVGGGLGSGAAVSAALMRAVASLFGVRWELEKLSALVYEVEKVHHGTPSGIDNTVVVYRRPVYFQAGEPSPCSLGAELRLLVADTGLPGSTHEAVAAVRRAREADPEGLSSIMDAIGHLAVEARVALKEGDLLRLGGLLNANHRELQSLDVSSPELDALVAAAQEGGALGAKMTGAGRGGHALALVEESSAATVRQALERAGARKVTLCRVPATEPLRARPRSSPLSHEWGTGQD